MKRNTKLIHKIFGGSVVYSLSGMVTSDINILYSEQAMKTWKTFLLH